MLLITFFLKVITKSNIKGLIGKGGLGGTSNIFNISPVLSIFRKKHLTFPLFRESTFTKQGKC